ncbi:MAG TPA: DUF3426 domain-containing protein [Burkholderiales bacterium]|nr:DUF3426 domain-containing protein [Burkholderiales bacterium]
MSMVTRCPACATLFRVTPEQLQARQGKVRCGRCAAVFDGFRDLATLPEPRGVDAAVTPRAEAPVRAPVLETTPLAPPSAAAPSAPAVPAQFRFESDSVPDAPGGEAGERKSSSVGREPRTDADLSTLPPLGAETRFLRRAHAAQHRGFRGWAIGSCVLVALLVAQAIYFYRGELAAHYRPLKPLLIALCRTLACDVPLPQHPKLVNIEASDMQSTDPTRPGVIRLTATLRNQADFDVAYPALDLVLTNTRDHTLARRIFAPREYLDPAHEPASGLPGKAEITIRLDLDTGDLGAAGFRLDLLPATS